ncbi:MAG: PQQ-binding-like beta-propeller repeat protein [Luminiphilus sp.]|nr:PQQ-binding-like beta-propeller repeat protein [Luminiphilus sp.]
MKKALFTLLLLSAIVGGFWHWLAAKPIARTVADDGGTGWRPHGEPIVSATGLPVNVPDTFQTMHVGLNNTDQLWIATAPRQEVAWTVELDMYVPEGPTMDFEGRVYFSPVFPREDVSLVVLEGATGERLWTLPHRGDARGAGAPLIMKIPGIEGEEHVYHATYHHAWAVKTDGTVVWQAPTGLRYEGSGPPPHAWGMNFVPTLDALVSVTQDGKIVALDRTTGRQLLAEPFALPGKPAGDEAMSMPPQWVLDRGNALAAAQFGSMPGLKGGLFTEMVMIIYGAGSNVSNFYAVEPGSGRLYVAATAPDDADGQVDGISDRGALYALDWRRDGDYLALEIIGRFDFDGGTGSTPTVANDGQRVYVSDENGNVIVLTPDLKEVWRVNVGDQLAASIAVSADNGELYAVTRYDIFKLLDRGDSGEVAWKAELDVFPGHTNVNSLTPTITANGLAVSIAASREFGNTSLLKKAGFGLLDRETGALRGFVEGPEESVSVTVVDRDGGFTIAHSPVRRLGAVAILGDSIELILGGITKYRSSDDLLLAREAACAAAAIQERSGTLPENSLGRRWDSAQVDTLQSQADRALKRVGSNLDPGQLVATLCERLKREVPVQ